MVAQGYAPGRKMTFDCGCETRLGMASFSRTQCPLHKAAPDLLSACKQIMLDHRVHGDMEDDCYVEPFAIGLCRAAIAKAEGGSL